MSEPITVDARFRPPPEPMHMAVAALDDLTPDGELIFLIHREPFPLYDMLRMNGYQHHTEVHADGTLAIHIRHAAQSQL